MQIVLDREQVVLSSSTPAAAADAPLVSIGLPVYNGARYLRDALDSLLAQEYPNFELIISDNASTDDTETICREYAARDERVCYSREEQNRGAAWNFNHVFHLSKGEFFMWAASDDLRGPRYVNLCAAALMAHPKAVLACTHIQYIDEEGRPADDRDPWRNNNFPVGLTVKDRVRQLTSQVGWYEIYGLMRRNVASKTRLYQITFAADFVFSMEMCLRGTVIVLPEIEFFYRYYENKTIDESHATIAAPGGADAPTRSFGGLSLDLYKAISLSPVGRLQKINLSYVLFQSYLVQNKFTRRYVVEDAPTEIAKNWRRRKYVRWLGLHAVTKVAALAEAHDRRREQPTWREQIMKGLWQFRPTAFLLHHGRRLLRH